MTLLTTMLDFSDTGEIGVAGHRRRASSAREAAIGKGGVDAGQGARVHVLVAARQRPDVAVRGQQLPQGQGAAGVRPAVLELGQHQPARPDVLLVHAQHVPREQSARSRARRSSAACRSTSSQIDVPAFLYASREDHIVPWHTAYAVDAAALRATTTFVLGASGHIAGVINPPAKNKRNYWADGRPGADPRTWLATAKSVPGSWWPALERVAGAARGR